MNHILKVQDAVASFCAQGGEPAILYCNKAFYEALKDELESIRMSVAAPEVGLRVSSIFGMEIRISRLVSDDSVVLTGPCGGGSLDLVS